MTETKNCPLCKKPFVGYGNNPAPFRGESCCDDCNREYVVPLRIYLISENPNYALRFKEDGTIEILRPKNQYFTLEELQEAVGGLIELYPKRYHDKLIVCDEEGLLKERPINSKFASLTSIELVGDIVLCPNHIFEEPDEEES